MHLMKNQKTLKSIVETDKKDIESCILKILSYLEKSKIIKPVV